MLVQIKLYQVITNQLYSLLTLVVKFSIHALRKLENISLFFNLGFSALAHKLSLRDDGTELLTNLINGFLGELINIILFYEGDVIKFAGDAIFVTWRVPSFPSATRAAQIKQCLLKPIQCAVDIQRKIKDYHMVDPKERTPIHLRVRISIADGDLLGMHVGLIVILKIIYIPFNKVK